MPASLTQLFQISTRNRLGAVLLAGLSLISAWNPRKSTPIPSNSSSQWDVVKPNLPHPPKRIDLRIAGYNYTRRYINEFSVDDHSGGNLSVSVAGSGGGGNSCCVPYFDGEGDNTVRVRWQSGACIFKTKSTISTDTYENIHSYIKRRPQR